MNIRTDTVQYDIFRGGCRLQGFISFNKCPHFLIDDQMAAVHMGYGATWPRTRAGPVYRYTFHDADCVIIAYSPLSRHSFERAMVHCRKARAETQATGVLLGVVMAGQDEGRRTVKRHEALEFANSILFQYHEIDTTNSDLLPLQNVIADLIRPLQDAEEEYVRESETITDRLSRLLPTSSRTRR